MSNSRPKVYIAAPFRSFSSRENSRQAYGELTDEAAIGQLEAIESVFLKYGFTTCLPHRDEGMWGRTYYDPFNIGALCLRHVETSDLIFAIAEASRGVHVELGYAHGLGKQKILMHALDHEPSTLLAALGEEHGSCGIETVTADS